MLTETILAKNDFYSQKGKISFLLTRWQPVWGIFCHQELYGGIFALKIYRILLGAFLKYKKMLSVFGHDSSIYEIGLLYEPTFAFSGNSLYTDVGRFRYGLFVR